MWAKSLGGVVALFSSLYIESEDGSGGGGELLRDIGSWLQRVAMGVWGEFDLERLRGLGTAERLDGFSFLYISVLKHIWHLYIRLQYLTVPVLLYPVAVEIQIWYQNSIFKKIQPKNKGKNKDWYLLGTILFQFFSVV